MEICVSGDVPRNKVCTKVPRGVQTTATFVIDLEKVDHWDISADDNGIYGKHSSPSQRVKLKLTDEGKIEEVTILNRGQAESEQDQDEGELFIVRRQYSWHKSTNAFCRIVSKVEHDGSFLRYAIVQYKVGDNCHHLSLLPHGNDRREDKEPYLRTKPSVMDKIRSKGKNESAKSVIRHLQGSDGVSAVESPREIPRDRQQVYNALKKVPGRIKSRNTGPPKTPEFSRLMMKLQTGNFLKDVSFTVKARKGNDLTCPSTFTATDTQLHWIKTYCGGEKPKTPMGMDMTYKVGPFYLMLLTIAHPMFVFWNNRSKHPTILVGMMTSCTRDVHDYEYLASNLKKHGIKTLTYGTDGELAMEKAFESVFPIDGVPPSSASIHLRCFEHIKWDMLAELKKLEKKKKKQSYIVRRILGGEFQGKRLKGLVDVEDEEFDQEWENIQKELPPAFSEWIMSKKGRIRSHVETIRKCMLKSVRIHAGLGNPPNKFDNQRSEAINNVVKEEGMRKATDQVHIHELIEERVVEDQRDELIKAIGCMGEYRLAEEFKEKAVSPSQWSQMTTEQRKENTKKVLHMKPENLGRRVQFACEVNCMSVPVSECDLEDLPSAVVKDIWARANIILERYNVIQLENFTFCVTEFDESYTVKQTAPTFYRCHCKRFLSTDGLCQHVLSVAEKMKRLAEFLTHYREKKNKASRVMFKKVPTNAGEKPSSKRRKGKNNVEARPITEEFDPHNLSHPKAHRYTQYYHNDKPFYVVFAKNHPQATQCISCDIAFPRRMPVAPYDLAFAHKERWQYPVRDAKGKIVEKKITKTKLTNRFYCLRPECVLKRHPYFWKGLIQIEDEVQKELKESHKKLLLDTFQVNL